MIDLGIEQVYTREPYLAGVRFWCGCLVTFDQFTAGPHAGTWACPIDCPQTGLCAEHKEKLRGVPRPVFPLEDGTLGGGYPWRAP